VNGLAVPLEPLGVDEGLGAEGAGVGPLARVDQAVAFEAGRVFVRLAAVPALVRSEREVRKLSKQLRKKFESLGPPSTSPLSRK